MRRPLLFLSVVVLLVALADSQAPSAGFAGEPSAVSQASFDLAPSLNALIGSGDNGDELALAPASPRARFGDVRLAFFHGVHLTHAQDAAARTPPARAPPSNALTA